MLKRSRTYSDSLSVSPLGIYSTIIDSVWIQLSINTVVLFAFNVQ